MERVDLLEAGVPFVTCWRCGQRVIRTQEAFCPADMTPEEAAAGPVICWWCSFRQTKGAVWFAMYKQKHAAAVVDVEAEDWRVWSNVGTT